jgi:hypothetical protein
MVLVTVDVGRAARSVQIIVHVAVIVSVSVAISNVSNKLERWLRGRYLELYACPGGRWW